MTAPGPGSWQADPEGRYEYRWWDGQRWTDQPIANQNSKLLRVRLGEPFMARQGSMVAYQGNVDFSFEGGGASRFIKKALTGEGLPLMRCQGQGDVFLAERAYDVHLLNLNNAGLSISGKNVLAFSSSLDWNIERVKGGSIATGGLSTRRCAAPAGRR